MNECGVGKDIKELKLQELNVEQSDFEVQITELKEAVVKFQLKIADAISSPRKNS